MFGYNDYIEYHRMHCAFYYQENFLIHLISYHLKTKYNLKLNIKIIAFILS